MEQRSIPLLISIEYIHLVGGWMNNVELTQLNSQYIVTTNHSCYELMQFVVGNPPAKINVLYITLEWDLVNVLLVVSIDKSSWTRKICNCNFGPCSHNHKVLPRSKLKYRFWSSSNFPNVSIQHDNHPVNWPEIVLTSKWAWKNVTKGLSSLSNWCQRTTSGIPILWPQKILKKRILVKMSQRIWSKATIRI